MHALVVNGMAQQPCQEAAGASTNIFDKGSNGRIHHATH